MLFITLLEKSYSFIQDFIRNTTRVPFLYSFFTELLNPNFVFRFDKIRIKNPILVFHFSIDEQLTEVGK